MPKYFIKVRYSTDHPSLTWEARPYWDETGHNRELNEVVQNTLDYLRKHNSAAVEIRVNEAGSLQGHYYDVKSSDDEMFIWMTQQDAGQLIRVFAKWLEAGWPKRIFIARALRDMGNSTMDHTHTPILLEQMSFGWVKVNINRKEYRGYLTRDYTLTSNVWMLSFSNMQNYCFDVEQVIEIESPNRGGTWSLTLKDDERFGK